MNVKPMIKQHHVWVILVLMHDSDVNESNKVRSLLDVLRPPVPSDLASIY